MKTEKQKNFLHVKIFQPLTPPTPPPPLPTLKKIMVCGFSLLTFSSRGRF